MLQFPSKLLGAAFRSKLRRADLLIRYKEELEWLSFGKKSQKDIKIVDILIALEDEI